VLAICLCAATGAANAFADNPGRAFKREDYEHYFSPGRFASHSPFYDSDGEMEVLSNHRMTIAGQYVLEQTTQSFDVSLNYDVDSAFRFYKIMSINTDQMLWDDHRGVYVYDYSAREFDTDNAQVWESRDDHIDISTADRKRGALHTFYRDVDKRAGRDAREFDQEFRNDVVGYWTWACAYVSGGKFDVACKARHETTGRTETYFYRRLDLIS
jgi:hypothetical protein